MIYFDNAATTRPNPEMLEIYTRFLKENFSNPSSTHRYGSEGEKLLKKAREQIARFFAKASILSEEVIFTSGATESNNLAIKGVASRYFKLGNHLITTKVEHPSVLKVFQELEQRGFRVSYLNVFQDGIDEREFLATLSKETILVSIMGVNNENGAIYDIAKLARLTKENSSAFFHSDITQALLKVEQDYKDVDLLSFSAHKLNGLKGSGLLIKRKRVDMVPLFEGGAQENGYRPGTLNLPSIIATSATIRLASETFVNRVKTCTAIKEYLIGELNFLEGVIITSPPISSPFILSFILKQHKASVITEALSRDDIMVSTKSACSSKNLGGSYVLKAYGFSERDSSNGIRLSFDGSSTLEEAKTFIKQLKKILSETRKETI